MDRGAWWATVYGVMKRHNWATNTFTFKEARDLHSENYKILWKKSKVKQIDGERDSNVLGLEEAILWKWLYYPKQSRDLMQILSNYQWHFSQNWDQKNVQYVWKHKLKLQCFNSLEKTRPWCWERWKAGGEGSNRGWDGWMASSTPWT